MWLQLDIGTSTRANYFCGPVHVARVQAWRSRHPGYWRKARRPGTALQDVSKAQSIDSAVETVNLARSPLQEVITAQPVLARGVGHDRNCAWI